jgi:hypothetical protein
MRIGYQHFCYKLRSFSFIPELATSQPEGAGHAVDDSSQEEPSDADAEASSNEEP